VPVVTASFRVNAVRTSDLATTVEFAVLRNDFNCRSNGMLSQVGVRQGFGRSYHWPIHVIPLIRQYPVGNSRSSSGVWQLDRDLNRQSREQSSGRGPGAGGATPVLSLKEMEHKDSFCLNQDFNEI
jgi:hypothetical protein